MLGRLLSTTLQLLPKNAAIASTSSSVIAAPNATNAWSLDFIRSRTRYLFRYPNERRRILRHGFWARMATPNGRRVIMRRILKGKHVLAH